MLQKIVSGGQTGADRAALDVALESSFPCGGFCPKDRKAEDGPIDSRYPLEEIEGGYRQRTWQNVLHSDGTVIFYLEEPTGGTLLTKKYCETNRKPHYLIDISKEKPEDAAIGIQSFLNGHAVQVLNVAGPRASECPEMYAFVESTISQLITLEASNEA